MRGILIDPYTETVTEVETDGSLGSMYKLIDCELVEAVGLTRNDTLWVDEEGLLKEGKPIWKGDGGDTPLAGRGLILGVRGDGTSCSTRLPVELVRASTRWTNLETTGEMNESTVTEGPIAAFGGKVGTIITGGSPILRERT